MSDNKHTGRSFGGKGYYIALVLCAAAIGISGYLYYRNANNPADVHLQSGVTTPDGEQVAVIATRPQGTTPTAPEGETVTRPPEKPLQTAAPVSGETIADYAMDCLGYNATTRDWRVHSGVDIAAEAGTPVLAAAAGTVYTTYEDDAMGMTVVIRHDGGYTTKYASLDPEVAVAPGDTVALGQAIGCVGNTALLESALGDHVHFSVTKNDQPIDPAEFLEQA